MFSTVLIPTDLSPASDELVSCAAGLAPLGMRSIVLMHALGLRHLEDMAPALEGFVMPKLVAQARALEHSGLPVEVVVVPGIADREINRLARERRASVVLLGSQGGSLASELRIGSVTLETLHRCEVPVLLARVTCAVSDEGGIECRALAKRILHPTDFSDAAERAFGYVRALVASGFDVVSLIHVQDRKDRSRVLGLSEEQLAKFDAVDRARLDRLERDLRDAGASYVHAEIAHGSPIQEILRRVAETPDVLVVMGTQGRGFIPEIFLGSVSHAVARRAAAPVLLVPYRPGREAPL